jgi:DNA-binding response OmpR family regulator
MDPFVKIIIVEDHEALRLMLVSQLQTNGYQSSGVSSGSELDHLLISQTPEIIILDINLPDESGLSIAQRVRSRFGNSLDIIMLTAYGEEADRISGYNSGADIYLKKPISIDELEAAIRSVSRRRPPTTFEKRILLLYRIEMRIEFNQNSCGVSRQELLILKALVEAPLQFVPAWSLLEHIGKETNQRNRAALDVAITRLRRKLVTLTGNDSVLKVSRGSGYQLSVPAKVC